MSKKFVCSNTEPIVETKAGKLRGYLFGNIYTFHGIKYADAERFQMPVPVKPWEGIKEATNYGYICPTLATPAPTSEAYIPHRFWPENEHCQYLNIWTQSIDPEAKKPVMVWLHGGGFSDGSSVEQVAYEGDELAKYGDVVVVTINHRLNILGFLDMSPYGEKYKNSANVGMADIVEALRWIQANIAQFGGDPENVTIFGQSGGGGKTQTLMQIPDAAGLFHKAIIMSGLHLEPRDAENDCQALIEGLLRELKIPENEVERLEKVPYDILKRAFAKVNYELLTKGTYIKWGPKKNDWYIGDPMNVGFSENAKKIPLMVGSVIAEMSNKDIMTDIENIPYEEKEAAVKAKYGDAADEIIDLFKKAYPDKDLTVLLKLDLQMRVANGNYAVKRAETCEAPTYLYLFTLSFDIHGSSPAWHCADIPFVFHNSCRVPCCNIEGVTERLEDEVCGAWVNFARTGDPNHANLDNWKPYTAETGTTMTFDRKSEAKDGNFDKALTDRMMDICPPEDMSAAFIRRALESGKEDAQKDWSY